MEASVAQLVGTYCVHCQQRIGNELDAEFCTECRQPRHQSCGQPTAGIVGKCTKCGAPFDAANAAAEAAASGPLSFTEKAREVTERYLVVKCLFGAAVMFMTGLLIAFAPGLRSDHDHITRGDVLFGAMFWLVGLVLALLGWWALRRAQRRAAARR
jgi:hypothetical protein